jgi:hypothetical protein
MIKKALDPERDAIRFNFRLNPRHPKEEIILDFLHKHAENYDASRIVKQALYEMATGRSWITDEPLKPSNRRDRVQDDMILALEDWMAR